ncbi:MAG: DNA helicase II, partial [Rhodospirillales bacterium]|nr:DNA helicase II [Rhodospirillales bacterium]
QSAIPSRFIDELPADHVEQMVEPGLYETGKGSGMSGMMAGFGHVPNRRHKPPMIEDTAQWVRTREDDDTALKEGQRVFHQKFGYGRILSSDGDKLEIDFEKAGTKKVMNSFVEVV